MSSPEQPSSTESISSQDTSAPIGGGSTTRSGPDIGAILARAQKIVTDPQGAWQEIKGEDSTIESVYKNYFVYVAAITPIAMFLGHIFHRNIFSNLFSNLVFYAFALGMPYLAAMLIEFLAPKFEGGCSRAEAFKLVVYASTPGMLAGIFNLIPILGIIASLIGLYNIYVFYLGLEPMVRVAGSKRLPFMGALILCGLAVGIVIAITGLTKVMF